MIIILIITLMLNESKYYDVCYQNFLKKKFKKIRKKTRICVCNSKSTIFSAADGFFSKELFGLYNELEIVWYYLFLKKNHLFIPNYVYSLPIGKPCTFKYTNRIFMVRSTFKWNETKTMKNKKFQHLEMQLKWMF